MKVLIIGGTRFIGLHLVPKLLAAGHEVTLFHRGQHPSPFAGDVRVILGDRLQARELQEKLAGCQFDAVIDMVAYKAADVEEAMAAFTGRVGQYLMISTASVYPIGQSPLPIRETDPLVDDPANDYGYNKARAEHALLRAHSDHGFPATILRMPAVYGPHDQQAREWYFIRRLQEGRTQILVPDGGLSIQHREHAANIAAQVVLMLSRPETIGQVYNSGHRQVIPYHALVRLAADIMGIPVELYSIPSQRMPWPIPLAEPISFVQLTTRLENLGYQEPYGLRQGLQDTIDYFTRYPIGEWVFEARSHKQMFDYQEEDRLIREHAIKI